MENGKFVLFVDYRSHVNENYDNRIINIVGVDGLLVTEGAYAAYGIIYRQLAFEFTNSVKADVAKLRLVRQTKDFIDPEDVSLVQFG
jgi:hypothetical protein